MQTRHFPEALIPGNEGHRPLQGNGRRRLDGVRSPQPVTSPQDDRCFQHLAGYFDESQIGGGKEAAEPGYSGVVLISHWFYQAFQHAQP